METPAESLKDFSFKKSSSVREFHPKFKVAEPTLQGLRSFSSRGAYRAGRLDLQFSPKAPSFLILCQWLDSNLAQLPSPDQPESHCTGTVKLVKTPAIPRAISSNGWENLYSSWDNSPQTRIVNQLSYSHQPLVKAITLKIGFTPRELGRNIAPTVSIVFCSA